MKLCVVGLDLDGDLRHVDSTVMNRGGSGGGFSELELRGIECTCGDGTVVFSDGLVEAGAERVELTEMVLPCG